MNMPIIRRRITGITTVVVIPTPAGTYYSGAFKGPNVWVVGGLENDSDNKHIMEAFVELEATTGCSEYSETKGRYPESPNFPN